MYNITVIVGTIPWSLMFKTKESAEVANDILSHREHEYVVVEDDFGHKLDARTLSISGFIFEDMEQTKMAHVERALHQTRLQHLAQRAAESDPMLRAGMMRGGPAILQPSFGPNGR